MGQIRKVLRQTGWQIVGKGVTSLSTLVILGLVSRFYGESGTGIFTLALTYLTFFFIAADLGLNAYVLHRLQGENVDLEWRKLLGLRLIWSVCLISIALLVLPFLPIYSPVFDVSVVVGVGALVGSSLFVTANALFQSRLRYDLSIIASSAGTIVSVIVVFLVIGMRLQIPFLMVAYVLGWTICGVVSVFLVRKFLENCMPIFSLSYARGILYSTWPVSLTLLVNTVYFRLDSVILSAYHPFADVGNYNLAYQLFQTVLVLPAFLMNSYYPLMLGIMKTSRDKFMKQTGAVVAVMFAVGVVCTFFTFFLSPTLIGFVAGGGFRGSEASLKILSFGFPAFFASSVLMWVYLALKRFKIVLVIYLVGFLVNLFLNVGFIPEYSYTAASYITGISEYLILALQLIILYGASLLKFFNLKLKI